MDNSKLNSNHNRYTTNFISGEKDFKFSTTDKENEYKAQMDVLNKRNKTMVPDTYDMPLEKMYTATPGLFGQRHTPDYNNLKNRNSDKYDPVGDYFYQKGDREHTSITKYTSNYISIDSRLRQKNPKYDTLNYIKLGENPLQVENKSNLLTIQINDSIKLEPNDKISLIGLAGESHRFVTGSNFFEYSIFVIDGGIKKYNEYLKINFPSGLYLTDILDIKKYDSSDLYIQLEIENPENVNNTPNNLSFLNGIHRIYLYNNEYPASSDYFFIKLNKPQSTGITIDSSSIIKITYLYKYGFAINKINSEYPVSFDNNSGYLVVKSVNVDNITVQMSKVASTELISSSYKTNFGGKNICIAKLNEIIKGDYSPSEYFINLDKIYNNVILIKLISSEFPSLNKLITNCNENAVNIKNNNKLYWQNYYEKDIYSIDIDSGNYTMEELIKLIEYKVSLVPRISPYTNDEYVTLSSSIDLIPGSFSLINNTPNIIEIENIKGDNTFKFNSYTKVKLNEKPFTLVGTEAIIQFSNPYTIYVIKVFYPNHQLNDKDEIEISGAIDTDGFLASDLNNKFIIDLDVNNAYIPVDFNKDYFLIRLVGVNRIGDMTSTDGGNAVMVKSRNLFRLRFDYHDTLGDFFGFRKLGDTKSITNYNYIISNRELYQNENIDSNLLCNPNSIKTINLKDDDYIYMTCNTLNLPENKINQMITFSKIKNVFAKILIKNDYNSIDNKVYNSFIQNPIYMHTPIQDLRELEFKFYDRYGNLFNFGDFEHSFTLEIVTIAEVPERTNFSAVYPKIN